MKSAKGWENTILHNKMKCIIVLTTVLLLVACNKEQKPVTFSKGESFMDVTPKFYSVNGAKIGLTYKFLNEPELWNYIDSMGIKRQLESKACDKHISFYPDSNILLKELVPTMQKIEAFRK